MKSSILLVAYIVATINPWIQLSWAEPPGAPNLNGQYIFDEDNIVAQVGPGPGVSDREITVAPLRIAGDLGSGDAPCVDSASTGDGDPGSVINYTILVLSIVLWGVSLFLIYEGSRFQKWMTAGDEAAPHPESGVTFSVGFSILIFLLWMPYWIFAPSLFDYSSSNIVRNIFWHPLDYAPAFILASLPAALIGLLKFLVAAQISYNKKDETGIRVTSPMPALIGAIVTLITLAASIVTLVTAF